jgi:hypothetical protein
MKISKIWDKKTNNLMTYYGIERIKEQNMVVYLFYFNFA